MEPVYQKYALFGEQPTVTGTLQTFRENYERVHSGLKAVLAHIQDEKSKTAEIQGQLVKANEALRAAAAMGAHFFRADPSIVWDEKTLRCNNCGNDVVAQREDRAVHCRCGMELLPGNFAILRQQRRQYRGGHYGHQVVQPNKNID
jgi:hypothetical protein